MASQDVTEPFVLIDCSEAPQIHRLAVFVGKTADLACGQDCCWQEGLAEDEALEGAQVMLAYAENAWHYLICGDDDVYRWIGGKDVQDVGTLQM